MSIKKKANLGCGPMSLKGSPVTDQELLFMGDLSEWLLIDKYIQEPGIVNWDIEDLSEIPDNYMEVLYSAHALEHISHKAVQTVLSLWYRKLAEGGKLVLNVPDIAWASRQVIKYENMQIPDGLYKDFFGQWGLLNIFYGSHSQPGEFHFSGFTKRSISDLLENVGFSEIDVQQYIDAHGMGILFVTAWKK